MAEGVAACKSLFDDSLLYDLEFSSNATCSLAGGVCPRSPGPGLCMRALQISDFSKGYPELLGQLTRVGDLTQDKYEAQFRHMQAAPATYFTAVVEDTTRGEVVASASLVIERKFIHSAALRGRLEDVVVSDQHRGKQLGKLLLETLTQLAIHLGCYKISLDCNEEKRGFYEKFGYKHEPSVFMCRRIFD